MLLIVLFLLTISKSSHQTKEIDTVREIGKSTVEIIKERGYLAKAFNFATSDGYVLNVVRANNPLINNGHPGGLANKSAVIFLHGITTNTQSWVINSKGAKPQNYGHLWAHEMDEKDLVKLLADDPTTDSFALTLINFGHEIWLMDRRPTLASQANLNHFRKPFKVTVEDAGSSKLEQKTNEIVPKLDAIQLENGQNPKYWNFSFDEQAARDLPELVDFVLEQTQRKKLALVGHSSGGAMILMALAEGKLSKDKLQHAMLWAPAMELGHGRSNVFVKMAPMIEMLLINYLGGVVPTQLAPLTQTFFSKICTPKVMRFTCQRLLLDVLGGEGGGSQKIEPEFFVSWPMTTGSLELVQLLQSIIRRAMHHFDYRSPTKNLIAYGSSKPPFYNVTNIDFESISLWTGNTDNLVTPTDTRNLMQRLKVAVEFHLVGAESDFFQHYSFLLHSNVSRLLNIPALRTIERADTM